MRVLLFTGKGGVGKTTVAAATAVRAAEAGLRTIVCSTDSAHSLADVFDISLGDRPTPILASTVGGGSLHGQQLDARARLEEAWHDVRSYVVSLLDWAGADAVEAEELAVIPGLEEVFALADIRELARDGDWDLVVVDCAPTAETLRLLSLPDVLGWYMDRVFPAQRRITNTLRPMLARMTNLPVADDSVFLAVQRFHSRLDGVRELLTDGAITSARLVVNAERLVIAEARRTHTYLALFGYHVDAVIANRLLPTAVDDPWFERWRAVQAQHLATIHSAFDPLPVLTAELVGDELVGIGPLRAFGEALYGDRDVAARLADLDPMRVDAVDGALVLSLHLPGASSDDVELGRVDGELLVSVGPHRRALVLPDSLARREVGGARVVGDRLVVSFVEA